MERHDLETRHPTGGDDADLGPRTASYPPEKVRWAGAVLWGVFPVTFLPLPILARAWFFAVLGVVFLGGYLAFMVGKLRQARRSGGARLDLHRNGLVVVGPAGRTSVLRWDTLVFRRRVINQRKNGTSLFSYGYSLMGPDGVALLLNEMAPKPGSDVASVRGPSFADPEVWDRKIQRAVYDAQLPAAVEALRAGQTVTYGGVHIDREELRVGDATIAWSDVETARIVNAEIQILPRRGQGRRLGIGQSSPNFEIVWALIRRCLGGRAVG